MQNKSPMALIVSGVVMYLAGKYAPNGAQLFDSNGTIDVFNTITMAAEYLGIGVGAGGIGLLAKALLSGKSGQ